jgi:hypothetical protein
MACLPGCAQSLKEIQVTNSDLRFTLLIAGDTRVFKPSLRSRIMDHDRNRSSIDVINLKK